MLIETSTREGMEKSLAELMDISIPELYEYIEAAADAASKEQWCFDQVQFEKAMRKFYSNLIEHGLPDEVLFFHLSCRIIGSEKESGYNLQELLTSKNSFSDFLAMCVGFFSGKTVSTAV